jgi:AraC family transcriptional regulator
MTAEERASGLATVLSTSGSRLSGLVVERTVFEANLDEAEVVLPNRHSLVVHNSGPTTLYWREEGPMRGSLVLPGQINLNPAEYDGGRAWDKRTEDVVVFLPVDSVHLGASPPALRLAYGVHDPLLAQLGRYLARSVELGESADSLYADALAHALGAHLVEHYSDLPLPKPSAAPDILSRHELDEVCDYIESNLHRPLTIAELAGVVPVSPSHFNRLFRQRTGEPPYRYVRDRRLQRAERLIVGTELPFAAIAAAVGFSDQSHLNRVMRSQRGITPGQLRRSARS